MAKVDKSQYTKQQWRIIKQQRKQEKLLQKTAREIKSKKTNIGFVLGNGTSRASIDPNTLIPHGKVYGCNAIYRTFSPDYLVAVDTKMILEIAKSKYQMHNEVWTNMNKAYEKLAGFNYFQPSKGWSSGPTALWLASQHQYEKVFILGFDYQGLQSGKKFNNIYADTMNYKKSSDSATFFGNWMRQTKTVIKENPQTQYVRVIAPDNYNPDELNTFENYSTLFVNEFQKLFNIN